MSFTISRTYEKKEVQLVFDNDLEREVEVVVVVVPQHPSLTIDHL